MAKLAIASLFEFGVNITDRALPNSFVSRRVWEVLNWLCRFGLILPHVELPSVDWKVRLRHVSLRLLVAYWWSLHCRLRSLIWLWNALRRPLIQDILRWRPIMRCLRSLIRLGHALLWPLILRIWFHRALIPALPHLLLLLWLCLKIHHAKIGGSGLEAHASLRPLHLLMASCLWTRLNVEAWALIGFRLTGHAWVLIIRVSALANIEEVQSTKRALWFASGAQVLNQMVSFKSALTFRFRLGTLFWVEFLVLYGS